MDFVFIGIFWLWKLSFPSLDHEFSLEVNLKCLVIRMKMICPIGWFCTNSSVRNNSGQIQDLWPSLQDPIVWDRTTPIDELCTFQRNFSCLWIQILIYELSACWWISWRKILNELQSSISLIQTVLFRAESIYLKKKSLKVKT